MHGQAKSESSNKKKYFFGVMVTSRRSRQRGSALAVAIVLLMLLAVIPVMMQLLRTSYNDTQAQLHQSAQADNVARAGLQDAISWFQRQSCQPVRQACSASFAFPDAAFNPKYPNDTQDSTCAPGPCSIGLVNNYALDPDLGLWARYEVRVQRSGAANPDAVHDISNQRVPPPSGVAGSGLCWYLESRGYVYRQISASAAFNASPNVVVGNATAATEIRRLGLALPGNAGAIVNDQSKVTLSNNGRAVGGTVGAGIGYYTGSTHPSVDGQTSSNNSGSGSYYTGTPNIMSVWTSTNTSVSDAAIFGMPQPNLKLLADYVVSSVAALPASYPALALVYIDGNADFGASPQLLGSGILYVNGNLTIESTNNAFFNGLIFATGQIAINGPADISGAVVSGACAAGSGAGLCGSGDGIASASPFLLIDGTNGAAQVSFDNAILNSVRQTLANYRENKAAYYVFTSLK
jgi:Tfp pilus assembly protein PilX